LSENFNSSPNKLKEILKNILLQMERDELNLLK